MQNDYENIKYVIYCRRSSDESSEKQTQSIPDQITRCIQYAKDNNLEIMSKPDDFSEFETKEDIVAEDNDSDLYNRKTFQSTRNLFIVKESHTAKAPYKRKKWRSLVNYMQKGKIRGLLSYSPDRQARNILEGGELISFVDDDSIGLSLKYTNFHFEPTASGKMMLGVWFVFAKQYSDAISENVLRGNQDTLAKGKALGAYKYGYRRREDGYYEPDGEKFDLMQEAFNIKINQRKSDEYISNWLNDRGWKHKRGDNNLEMTSNKLNKVWKDTFYYGILTVTDRIFDQISDNPYYKPMITKEQYETLADRREIKKTPVTLKKIKDEYEAISCIPRNMLLTLDNYSVTPNLPNKKRFLLKLAQLKKTNPNATLKDIVKPINVRYGVKQKLSQYQGLEITGADIEFAIVKKLKQFKISDEVYKEYVDFMKTELQNLYDDTSEKINVLSLRINNVRSEMRKYVDKHMGIHKDRLEEEIYHNKKKEYQFKIDRLNSEREELTSQERSTILEYEMLFDMMNRAVEYYQNADYVQKAKFSQIFFSNILLNEEKGLHVAVKPIFEGLFISNGADNEIRTRNLFLGKEAL